MNSELRIKAERAVRDAETFDIQISTGLISSVPTDAEFWKGNQVEMESSRKHNEWLDTGVWTKHTAIITALPMAHRITLQSPAYDASVSDGSDELKQLMESLGEVLVFRHMEKA